MKILRTLCFRKIRKRKIFVTILLVSGFGLLLTFHKNLNELYTEDEKLDLRNVGDGNEENTVLENKAKENQLNGNDEISQKELSNDKAPLDNNGPSAGFSKEQINGPFQSDDKTFQIKAYGMYSKNRLGNGKYDKLPLVGDGVFQKCTYKNCNFTLNAETADVILVEMLGMDWGHGTPPRQEGSFRKKIWILYTSEPPTIMNATFWARQPTRFDGVFSYHRSSDVVVPYGCTREYPAPRYDLESKVNQLLSNKTNLVAWLVSNCRTQSDRGRYNNALQKYITVDVYGKCGNLTCQRWGDYPGQNPCGDRTKEIYKFYLAFENSICEDYITEKAWKTLGRTVPIVLGGADYKNVLPPNSFIDVADFASPQELADYLHELDQDDAKYAEYYAWVPRYKTTKHCMPEHNWKCDLCRYVNQAGQWSEKQAQQMREGSYNKVQHLANQTLSCTPPESFYKNILK